MAIIHYKLLIVAPVVLVILALIHPLIVFFQHVVENPKSSLDINIVNYSVRDETVTLVIELIYGVPIPLGDFKLSICGVEKHLGELKPGNYTLTVEASLEECESSRYAELSFSIAGLYRLKVVVRDWLKLEK